MTKNTAIAVVALVLVALAAGDGEFLAVNVRYNAASKAFSVAGDESFGPVAASVATNLTYYTTGWDVVTVSGNSNFMNTSEEYRLLGYHAGGYGEGYLNYVRIYQNYLNTFQGAEGLTAQLLFYPQIVPWIEQHYAYLQQRAGGGDDIGKVIGGMLALIEGLAEGYNAANTDPSRVINATEMFWMSFQAEVGDLITAYASSDEIQQWLAYPDTDPRRLARHCSALVKILPDDVYFSHVTWSGFNSMLRQYKTYVFENRSVTMSGYPAVVHSIDDWYMTKNRLAVMETTNAIYNGTLFQEFVRPGTDTISEFLRVMVANFLANSSAEWVTLFSTENSGTYNNQWMIFDMKQFTPGKPLPNGTFWVAEQLPGFKYPYGVTAADETSVLRDAGYWGSYNLPYFSNVYNVSGNLAMYVQEGNFFSYTNYARAKIFRRNNTDVVDVDSMKALMRYNNYKVDPFSIISNCSGATDNKCNPPYSAMLAIASRGDLNPPGGEKEYGVVYHYLRQRNHCGTDAKIAVWSKMQGDEFSGVVINGPTSYQQPVFSWSTSPWANDTSIIRNGLPDRFDFPFQDYSVSTSPFIAPPANQGTQGKNDKTIIGVGVGVGCGAVVAVAVVALVLKTRSKTRDESEQTNLVERV